MRLRKRLPVALFILFIVVSFVGYAWAAYEGAWDIPGDINMDGIVDIFDVVTLAVSFGSEPGDENWNPAADTNHDDIVDIFDAVVVTSNFGMIQFKAVVNDMRDVDVLVRVNISDGLSEKEAELIAEATFIQVMGQNVIRQLDTLTFDDAQIEAHYTWGYDENDMGHVFEMTADLITLQITVTHCFC